MIVLALRHLIFSSLICRINHNDDMENKQLMKGLGYMSVHLKNISSQMEFRKTKPLFTNHVWRLNQSVKKCIAHF